MTFKVEFYGGPFDGALRELFAVSVVTRVFASGMRYEDLSMPGSVEIEGQYYRFVEIRPGKWGYRWLAPQ